MKTDICPEDSLLHQLVKFVRISHFDSLRLDECTCKHKNHLSACDKVSLKSQAFAEDDLFELWIEFRSPFDGIWSLLLVEMLEKVFVGCYTFNMWAENIKLETTDPLPIFNFKAQIEAWKQMVDQVWIKHIRHLFAHMVVKDYDDSLD